ncbi:MAG: hypothetical protein LBD73_02525 [Deferribacteraceae bacterium]|nr:hypothetical protein [Deferribacteraceae bacterium]
MGSLKKILTALLVFSFIIANAVSYSYIAVSIGHEGADHHENCDTCKKVNIAVANLTHSVTILTEDTLVFQNKAFSTPYARMLTSSDIVWVHTLIASKVQFNC